MNKRFILKFAKYMSLYFIITTILTLIGFLLFTYLATKPSHINKLDDIELELYPPYSPQRVEVPNQILELAQQVTQTYTSQNSMETLRIPTMLKAILKAV